jgi:CRISPR-associated protein Cas5t
MIWLAIEAPFAACRPMMAGWHRPTAGFLTHSAAYGLILNVAGVESRLGEHEPGHPGGVPASVTRPGIPSFRIALGLPAGADLPRIGTVFQQLHNYSVAAGNAGIKPEFALGRKNNIAPVRRELLSDLRAVVAIHADDAFSEIVRRGLRGEGNDRRYGLPFLGDNNFTLDRLDEVGPRTARWFVLADAGRGDKPGTGTTRLTAYIDRRTPVGTRSALFVPVAEGDASETPPETALVPVGDPRAFDDWAKRHWLG